METDKGCIVDYNGCIDMNLVYSMYKKHVSMHINNQTKSQEREKKIISKIALVFLFKLL